MKKIPESSTREKIARMLEWITHANRPLKLYEILNAIGVDPTDSCDCEPKTVNSRILEFCKPLVEISRAGTVQFIHFSATE
jgi:hypothetical protein